MEKFITASPSSKSAHQMLIQSAPLPVNILIFGDEGVGKKTLVNSVFPTSSSFEATILEEELRNKSVDISNEKTILIYNIDKANNVTQFIQNLLDMDIKIIATARENRDIFEDVFIIKVNLSPLCEREEDTQLLKEYFMDQAKKLFLLDDVSVECVNPNLEKNAISLKESIYRMILLNSLKKDQMMGILENFLYDYMQNHDDYKDLLELFEVPLLKASKRRYKSQLKMAQKLNINRNTLRKKLNQYNLMSGEE
jgi:DNA-binding NtrC family response regulator